MPIIRNLRKDFDEGRMDNLRSLTYEERGTQGPYVKKDINNPPSSSQLGLQANKRIDDVSRIAQMLVDKPGLKHLSNEAILKQGEITKKLEGKDQTTAGKVLRRIGGTVKHVTQVAASTLAQVPVNGTGTHFLRAFRTDTYLQDGDPASGFASFFGAGGVEGSQYTLRGERVPVQGVITDSKLPDRNTTANPGDIGKYHVGIEGDLTTEDTFSMTNPGILYTESDTLTNVNNVVNGESIPKPSGLTRNTTPSKGTLGVTNKDVEGDISVENDISAYNSAETYTKTDTKENIIKANSGFPINGGDKIETINPLTGQITELTIPSVGNTTPEKGTFGVTNKDVEGDITGPQGLPDNSYSSDNSYTETDTKDNINNIQNGFITNKDGAVPLRPSAAVDTVDQTFKDHRETSSYDFDGNLGTSTLNTQAASQGSIQDFRDKNSINEFSGRLNKSYSFDYKSTKINKETRVGLGNPGRTGKNRTSYNNPSNDSLDALNYLDVLTVPAEKATANSGLNGILSPKKGNKKASRDLIQFEFQIMTPDDTHYLGFRAFLDTFDDSFNASWNSHKYLGRADNFYTYSGFDRSINIGFKIAAQSREEMEPLYRKAATLASVTAPTYGTGGRFMRGSLAKVTVGDYIYEQPGIIESVQYTWQKDYPWEISFQTDQAGREQILPHVLDVNLTFKVIHDFLPETGVTPLITNRFASKTGKKNYIELKASEALKTKTDKEQDQQDATNNSNEVPVGAESFDTAPNTPPPVSGDLAGAPSQFPNFG